MRVRRRHWLRHGLSVHAVVEFENYREIELVEIVKTFRS